MDIKIKSQWVRNLRSGNYLQGRENLKRDNKYCCLGVLIEGCDILKQEYGEDGGCWVFTNHGKEKIKGAINLTKYLVEEEWDEPENHDAFLNDYALYDQELDYLLLKFFGISGDEHSSLIEMNDKEEFDFVQIADWIEENL